jgi:tRNA(Ile)-lysidine synthase
MLQLLRGSGLKGLSSMQIMDDQKSLLRPLLNVNPELIDEYVRTNNIEYVNDESNTDDRFDRNYLRNNVLPNLIKRSPSTLANIARSISLIAEGYQLNESIALLDFKKFIDQSDLSRIRLDAFNQLPKDRFINLVRFWLSMNDLLMPSMGVMQELFNQMSLKNHPGLNAIDVSKTTKIIAYQDFLWIVNTTKGTDYEIDWHGEKEINLPCNGRLNFIRKKGQGLDFKKLDNLKIRNRRGGEKIKLSINEPTRTLKNLLNNHQIPPWYRDQFPVLVSDKDVVAVPIFGVNLDYQVKGPEYGYILDWQPSI